MITIKEIIKMCRVGILKDAYFTCNGDGQAGIIVLDGVPYFYQPCVPNVDIFSLPKKEINRIEKESDYFFISKKNIVKKLLDAKRKYEKEHPGSYLPASIYPYFYPIKLDK